MTLPYIQIVGCVLLLWIGVKLLLPEDDDGNIKESSSFWEAVKTIIIADIVMSIDNVLGMAGAAQGHLGMLFLGLLITMPLILFGSAMLVKLMERFPSFVVDRRRAARLRRRRHGGRRSRRQDLHRYARAFPRTARADRRRAVRRHRGQDAARARRRAATVTRRAPRTGGACAPRACGHL